MENKNIVDWMIVCKDDCVYIWFNGKRLTLNSTTDKGQSKNKAGGDLPPFSLGTKPRRYWHG